MKYHALSQEEINIILIHWKFVGILKKPSKKPIWSE